MPDQRPKRTIDERIDAIVMTLELLSRDLQDLKAAAEMDGEHIRGLVRIAEMHERRVSALKPPMPDE